MEKANKNYDKSSFRFIYWSCAILIPLVIILVSNLMPKNMTTWIFAIVTVALYAVGVCLGSKII